jgi:hypothetical protein
MALLEEKNLNYGGLDTYYYVNSFFDSFLFCNIFNNFSNFTQASIVVLPMLFSSFIAAVPFTGTT